MEQLILTELLQIDNPKGNIYHGMKKSDEGFNGFGEAYFSIINKGCIKGWKKHTRMTLNLIVPFGEVEFIIHNEKTNKFSKFDLSQKNYQRLTIPPNFWLAFRGIEEVNIVLNIANIEHDASESINWDIKEISYEW